MKKKQQNLISVLIVDDEPEACDNLEAILTTYAPDSIHIAGKATDTIQAEVLIRQSSPDLVLLDIHIPNENGFEFLSRLGQYTFEIIFVTAYDQYALKAFKLNAIDYILKPISIQELTTAVDKVKERLLYKKIAHNDQLSTSRVLQQVYNKTTLNQFTFKDKQRVNVVLFEHILYIEAMGSYSKMFYTVDGKEQSYVLSHSLSEYEELLPPELFYRVHKSYLINRMHVVNVSKDGNPTALLSSNFSLPVGRRRLSSFLSFLSGSSSL